MIPCAHAHTHAQAELSGSKFYEHQERPMLGFNHENKNPRRTHAHLHNR
jgi:hypothetical protein